LTFGAIVDRENNAGERGESESQVWVRNFVPGLSTFWYCHDEAAAAQTREVVRHVGSRELEGVG